MSNLSKLFPSPSPVLIDGGLGMMLTDVFKVNLATSLWSSEALVKSPESVLEAHLLFLQSGARLIEAASYQGSFSTYARAGAGYSRDDATRLMRSSVTLAAEARQRFTAETHVPIDAIKIALSLAAYGGSLTLPHEFDGYYPPPYGPKAYVPQPDPTGPNRNAFRAEERVQEAQSEEVLAAFHLERLRVYASDKETWHAVDALAFETIPLAREVRAIRRAVAALEDELTPEERKPWWICTVHAAGEFPEERPEGGGRLGAKEVLASYFNTVPTSTTDGRDESVRYAVPDAFGINCTATLHVASAVAAASDVLAQTGAARVGGGPPWLVLKPNGGQKYDMDTREWDRHDSEIWSPGDEWARQVGDIVHAAVAKGVWGGILVGGCCKTGHVELRALSKVL